MIMLLRALACVLGALLPLPVLACVTLTPGVPVPSGSYNPFDGSSVTITLPVSYDNSCGSTKDVKIAFFHAVDGAQVFKSGANQITYAAANPTFVTLGGVAFPAAGGSHTVSIPTGTGAVGAAFSLNFASGQVVPPGTYSPSSFLIGWNYANPNPDDTTGSAAIPLSLTVSEVLSLNLAGTFTDYTLNLGALTTGATGNVNLGVRSNRNFSVSVEMDNAGSGMKLQGIDVGTWFIPYTATLNGTATSHGDSRTGGASPVAGHTWPFVVTVGDTANKRAGTYQDKVVFSIAPSP